MSGKINTGKYPDSILNLLVDYYPEIPGRPYGSGATRENVIPVLKELQLGYILIYAKGHSGRTTFNSSLKTQHVMLSKHMPAFFREVTRETGTKLFLYYSGLVDGIAAIRNPDWRMRNIKGDFLEHGGEWGKPYLLHAVCPQSPYFDEWVSVHLKEMFETADPDGIWNDGDWPGPCYCPRCVERFRKESGYFGPMPEPNDLLSPQGIAWSKTWGNIKREWQDRISGLVKELKPECIYSSGNVTPRMDISYQMDWRSGDWFTPLLHRLQQSSAMRRYSTQDLPYDAMTCDTYFVHPRYHLRSRSKTLQRMLQEGAGIMANGGRWCYWTYPMPNGAFIPSKMRKAKAAAEFAEARKNVCLNTESVKWTVVLDAEPRACQPLMQGNVQGACNALIAMHRSPDIIDELSITDIIPYDLIVLPEQAVLDDNTVEKLEKFVKKGGKLISSGVSILSEKLQQLLGVRLEKRKVIKEGHVFLKAGDPVGVFGIWDRISTVEAEELYPLYRSWDDENIEMRLFPDNYPITGMVDEENPEHAGFPGATIRKLGKGIAVHIPVNIFAIYSKYGYPDILAWIREIIEKIQPDLLFKTDAPSFVEVSLREKEDKLLVHFTNGNSGRDLSFTDTDDLWVDDIPAIGPITCWIKCPQKPVKVNWEPGGMKADVEWENGLLKVTLQRLEIHTCLVIEDWNKL